MNNGKGQGMAKIIQFKKMQQAIKKRRDTEAHLQGIEDDISAILNDYSLTPSNRRWKLENMLMNVDEQLEQYRKELEQAELKLGTLVTSAEMEISRAYAEFESQVRGMTRAVKKLTSSPRNGSQPAATGAATTTDQTAPK